MNYKRRKPRRKVKCTMCTDSRDLGNSLGKNLGRNANVQLNKIRSNIDFKEGLEES